jgi:uncharacterized protein
MRKTALLFGFLVGLVGVPLCPQTPPAAANLPAKATPAPTAQATEKKIDPAKETDIRKLLELTGATTSMELTMQNMEKNIKPVLANSLPPGDYRDKLVSLFFEKFHAKMDMQKLIDLAVPIYDKYYSQEDLKGLIQFYQTPLGQKTVKALPSLMGELTEAGQKLGQDAGRVSMLEVLAEHPELEKAMEDAQAQK